MASEKKEELAKVAKEIVKRINNGLKNFDVFKSFANVLKETYKKNVLFDLLDQFEDDLIEKGLTKDDIQLIKELKTDEKRLREFNKKSKAKKKKNIALILACLFGELGIDRFYLGSPLMGFTKLGLVILYIVLRIANAKVKTSALYILAMLVGIATLILWIRDIILIAINKVGTTQEENIK